MADVNLVLLSGVLRADPELRYGPSGTAYVAAMLDLVRDTADGPKTYGFPFVIWGEQAERLANDLCGGDAVLLQGALRNRRLERDGVVSWRTELTAHSYRVLSSDEPPPAPAGAGRPPSPAPIAGGRRAG